MYPSLEYISSIRGNKEKHIKKNFPDFYQYIIDSYKDVPFLEGLYRYSHSLIEPPKCEACGINPTHFINYYKGYSHYCCRECFQKNAWYDKFTQSNIKRLGVKHHFQLKEYRDKAKSTIVERYGFYHAMKNNSIKDKFKKSCKEKYGTEWYTQTADFKEKAKQTNLKKRGVEFPMQLKEVRDQANLTNIERYGGTGFASPELLKKAQDTFFDRTGKEWNCLTESQLEDFAENILKENNIEYIKHDRNVLNGKELDFYIPSKKLAIECNGCFWHSCGGMIENTEFNKQIKPLNYHIQKYKDCLLKNIKLITLWEDQIKKYPNIVKSLILSKLEIFDTVIDSLQCSVKEISRKQYVDFLSKNYIFGKTNSGIKLGLFYNETLIGVAGFLHNKLNEWRITRLYISNELNVVDGQLLLLNFFINKYNPKIITAFSFNDIAENNLYSGLKFKTDNKINKCYWYIKLNNFKRYHSSVFSKTRLKEMGYNDDKSEHEIMKNTLYMKICDSGYTKWILNL